MGENWTLGVPASTQQDMSAFKRRMVRCNQMRIRFVLYGLLCTGVLLGAPRQVQSQQRTNAISLPVETVLSSRSFPREAPSLSPTGEWLAYTVQRPSEHTGSIGGYDFLQKTGAPKWLAGADVWMTNTNTGESVNITAGKGT